MEEGWVKLHKKFIKWEWYDEIQTKVLFIHLLLTVNYEDRNWRGTLIRRGQTVTTLRQLAKTLRCSVQQIRTCLDHLKSTHEITQHSTPQHTVITLVRYDDYQTTNTLVNTQSTHEQHTSNKRPTLPKEDTKKYKKEKKDIGAASNEFRQLTDYFCSAFKQRFGDEYPFQRAKDGSLLSACLKKYGLEKAKGLIDQFLKSDDEFIKRAGYSVGVFHSQIPKLLSGSTAETRNERVLRAHEGGLDG